MNTSEVRTPSPAPLAPSSEESDGTPTSSWSGSEDVFVEGLVDRLTEPLWLIARALARIANVPMSELQAEDADGGEFSVDEDESATP